MIKTLHKITTKNTIRERFIILLGSVYNINNT